MINTKINVTINHDLKKKYGIRRFPISRGDIVKIVSGSRKGEGGKVIAVNHKTKKISIEGITIAKSDGKQVAYFVDHSNLVITKLDLSVEGRYNKIKNITVRRNLPTPEPEIPEPLKAEADNSEPVDNAVENEAEEPVDQLEEAHDDAEPEDGDDKDEN
ncbi:MAG: 50S ribosomal protein L24 [Ferroplasma sp.]